MRSLYNRFFSSAAQLNSTLLVSIGCAALVLFLVSCSSLPPAQREISLEKESILPVFYSMVFIIHGDNDYLYHDTSGNEYNADVESVAGAQRVAQQNPSAEVFIFHQKSKRHFLFFFPLHDGEFYYYRNGQLVVNELYWRNQQQSHFDPEVDLYHRFQAKNQQDIMNLFLYCGHEIPEVGGTGYDASYPDRVFTVHDFANGLKGFKGDSSRFDLMILSTCFGGTPYTIGTLGSYARYVIASPENLHLSYFDLHSLERLDFNLRSGNVHAFAKRFANQAFDRLTSEIQTAVSVVVYDMDRVQNYLNSVSGVYDSTLVSLKRETQFSNAAIKHCDCADLSAYILPTMNEGVNVFYRPARFGRSKYRQNHSGWECLTEVKSRRTTSQSADTIPKQAGS